MINEVAALGAPLCELTFTGVFSNSKLGGMNALVNLRESLETNSSPLAQIYMWVFKIE